MIASGRPSLEYFRRQMRILGSLIVVLGLAAVVLIVAMRRVVEPALRRRHIADLERRTSVSIGSSAAAHTTMQERRSP
jgi:peptidoglycan/LPS O-acetylase OafA/YrhL